jgi:hypothetical protein
MSRARSRRIGVLQDPSEGRDMELDRRFYERHPYRRHRIRRATRTEITAMASVHGIEATALLPGDRWFVVTRLVAPGAWVKVFIINKADSDTDVAEDFAASLFDLLSKRDAGTQHLEDTVRMLAAARGGQ